ncbi:MAG: HK97 gp10 family phage protein [Clostridiales bacterium]
MSVVFENNSIAVKKALDEAGLAWLYEASGEICSQTQRNTEVDTGKTKGSWRTEVDARTMTATVGSNSENAIWEEFGTGEYAAKGNGRKGGWVYKTAEGKHFYTRGKHPRRAFDRAYRKTKPKVLRRANEIFKGVGD